MSGARRLDDWLAHIQRQHWRSVDLTLQRVAEVWNNLGGDGDGDGRALTITVAGTNGKGSSVAMLESVLRAAGVRVGAYTSPHLVRYNERVRVDGVAASDAELCAAFAEVERARDGVPLTYFEFGTLCALLIFRAQKVTARILEVGMGGRLDAVNIIHNDLALITAIGLDHTAWLGGDRDAIAAEKAGVIKKNAAVVCADRDPPKVIAATAAERGATLLQNGVDFFVGGDDAELVWRSDHPASAWSTVTNLKKPPGGAGQRDNLAGVVAAVATVAADQVTPTQLIKGVADADLKARCQVIAGDADAPEIILDVAHNPDAARDLAGFVRRRPRATTHAVFAALTDKPVAAMAAAMDGVVDHWHLAGIDDDRGQSAAAMAAALGDAGVGAPATTHDTPLDAMAAAVSAVGVGRVVVFGSFHAAGAIIARRDRATA